MPPMKETGPDKPKGHEHFMRMALQQAAEAAAEGEVPVGAVIVRNGAVIGRAHNQVELLHDPTAHAEMIAITQAAAAVGDWRLNETVLYVTREPCRMCLGAIALARIPHVFYGAKIPEGEEFPSPASMPRLTGGLLEEDCRLVLQGFFRERRDDSRGAADEG